MPDQLLTPVDLARKLQIPVKTIYAWRQRGIGPSGVRVGRHIRFAPQEVDRWLDEQAAV